MVWSPEFRCVVGAGGERSWRVGHEVVDGFLEFAQGRARPNTVRAYAHDLNVFFGVVGKEPAEVTSADVLAFIERVPGLSRTTDDEVRNAALLGLDTGAMNA